MIRHLVPASLVELASETDTPEVEVDAATGTPEVAVEAATDSLVFEMNAAPDGPHAVVDVAPGALLVEVEAAPDGPKRFRWHLTHRARPQKSAPRYQRSSSRWSRSPGCLHCHQSRRAHRTRTPPSPDPALYDAAIRLHRPYIGNRTWTSA